MLGDQLDLNSAAFEGFDCDSDTIWMAESAEEITYVWSHQVRIAFLLSAMRHFREQQRAIGREVQYHELTIDADQDRGDNFAELWGADPKAFHDWHMAMYVDAIDWVFLSNTLGMSQYGDGDIVGTKPYCSSGNDINKMSNFCGDCRFSYKKRVGDDACPFTTLYWGFMGRHYDLLKRNARMKFPMKNLERMRLHSDDMQAIRDRADELRELWG